MLIQIADLGDPAPAAAAWLYELGVRIELKAIEARQ